MLKGWRDWHEAAWMRDVSRLVSDSATKLELDGRAYIAAMADPTLNFPQWNKSLPELRAALEMSETRQAFLEAMQTRIGTSVPIDELESYWKVYVEYVVDLVSKPKKPDPNDHLDLDIFLYCRDNFHVLATFEEKWKNYANLCGVGHRVRYLG
jgi:hypothetical protein